VLGQAGHKDGEARGSKVIPFPTNEIHDEDAALDWWEHEFAESCESIGAQVNAAALTHVLVASIRQIRDAASDTHLSLTEAAAETGFSAKQISRWVKTGKIANVGRPNAPRVRRRDIQSHKKAAILPAPNPLGIVETAQDIARCVANSKQR
jgi:uncharacterized protein YifN (PemK superfamily)